MNQFETIWNNDNNDNHDDDCKDDDNDDDDDDNDVCCRLPPEERQLSTSLNPMCEVFPKGGIDDWFIDWLMIDYDNYICDTCLPVSTPWVRSFLKVIMMMLVVANVMLMMKEEEEKIT